MPPWGRPSGGRQAKRRKEWERQQREWEEQRRFEEIDSESDDDGQGVGLDRQFTSDELHFTGADLSRLSRDRRKYEYSEDSEDSDNDDDDDDGTTSGAAMQVALREKEEVLVQRAMQRIQRAQMMGKPHVKLTGPERDALERKIKNDQTKSKRPALISKAGDVRRSSGRSNGSQTALVPAAGKRKGRSSLNSNSAESGLGIQAPPPGFVVAGPDGQPVYAPLGYYSPPHGSPYGPSSHPGSRSGSSHSLQHGPPSAQYRGPQKRYFSVPEQQQHSYPGRAPSSPRPMPDDLDWQPRARSSSSLPYPPDPHQYQAYSPPLPPLPRQYAPSARRNTSGPPDIGYPIQPQGPSGTHPYASDPALARQRYSGASGHRESTSEEDPDDDDDEDHGVQVDVVPRGQGYNVNVTTGASGSSVSRQRKSRR